MDDTDTKSATASRAIISTLDESTLLYKDLVKRAQEELDIEDDIFEINTF
jgi:hypothetical protein